jgi:hypothetical protein
MPQKARDRFGLGGRTCLWKGEGVENSWCKSETCDMERAVDTVGALSERGAPGRHATAAAMVRSTTLGSSVGAQKTSWATFLSSYT